MKKRITVTVAGEILRQHREFKNWSQQELAKRSKCSQKTIDNAEKNNRIRTDVVQRIAKALGVAYHTLVSAESQPAPERKSPTRGKARPGKRAYISSTVTDLKEHRQFVKAQLEKAGYTVVTADTDGGDVDVFDDDRLEGCELFVLLLAFRRGYVPTGEAKSIVQMEYEHALQSSAEVLVFLLDDKADWPDDERDEDAGVKTWRTELAKRARIGYFQAKAESVPLAEALQDLQQRRAVHADLQAYRDHIREIHGIVHYLGLPQLKDNPDSRIDDLFVPQYMAPYRVAPESDPEEWMPRVQGLLETVAQHKRLVVLGDPGCGKSTLVNWLAWNLAGDDANPWRARLAQRMPIPIILRDLSIGADITWSSLVAMFLETPVGKHLKQGVLDRLLRSGQAFLLIDGIDEIGSKEVRQKLRRAVQEGMLQYRACWWVMTSRVVGYDEVPFHLRDVKDEYLNEIHDTFDPYDSPLIKMGRDPWKTTRGQLDDPEKEADVVYVAPFNDDQIKTFAHNWYSQREQQAAATEKANDLVQALHRDPYTIRLARIANPLTMMALIHRVKARLPNGRALLYDEITQAYLETIPQYRKLDDFFDSLADRKCWLGRVGMQMQLQRVRGGEDKEVLADENEVRRWIAEGMQESGKAGDDDEARDFVEFIKRKSGLMIERADKRFAFVHLFFQEYFAAYYLQQQLTAAFFGEEVADEVSPDAVKEYADQDLWRETLVFLFELCAAQPPLSKRLRETIFGEDWQTVREVAEGKTEGEKQEQRVCLLTRLALDPQAGLSPPLDEEALHLCCVWQLERTEKQSWKTPTVFQILLTGDVEERRQHTEFLWKIVKEGEYKHLDLSSTPVSDLSKFPELPNLQTLYLSSTPVSDLSKLPELPNLQTLYLIGTPVSDESVRKFQEAHPKCRVDR